MIFFASRVRSKRDRRTGPDMKILIVGAGVIGQIYAARLHEAGHEVTVLARHQTLPTLIQDGITLVNEARPHPPVQRVPVRVEVTGEVGPDRSFELALVTVRRDQVDEILPALPGLPARSGRLSISPASAGTAGTTVPSPT